MKTESAVGVLYHGHGQTEKRKHIRRRPLRKGERRRGAGCATSRLVVNEPGTGNSRPRQEVRGIAEPVPHKNAGKVRKGQNNFTLRRSGKETKLWEKKNKKL